MRSSNRVPWPRRQYTVCQGRRPRGGEHEVVQWSSMLGGFLLVCLLAGMTLLGPAGHVQEPVGSSASPEAVTKQALLVEIVRSMEQLERDLQEKQAELRSPQAEGRKEELLQQVQALGARLDTLRQNFSEIAAGVDLKVFAQQDEPFDWQKSLLAFLRPVLSELQRLTARPREIEHLRTQIARYKTQQQVAEHALENITRLAGQSHEALLAPHLQRLQREWQQRYQEISTQVSVATQQLKHVLGEERSLGESVHSLLEIFFRSRTRNFLLVCLTFGLVWLALHRLRHAAQQLILRRRKHLTFAMRLFTVAGTFFTILGATFSFLLALYILEDWVLLTLAVLVLLGVVWTSQSTLPRFMHEPTDVQYGRLSGPEPSQPRNRLPARYPFRPRLPAPGGDHAGHSRYA